MRNAVTTLSYLRAILSPYSMSMPESDLLAAIDLGSNSFRLLVARSAVDGSGTLIQPIDSVKRSVRLAAGLDRHDRLDAAAQMRGLEALGLFSQRLRAYAPSAVRAVATNALRVARNAPDFLADAQAVLGYPIEVISGHEEARLIWVGASHALNDPSRKLIIDIGGGSTECILGETGEPLLLDSIAAGCVSALSPRDCGKPIDAQTFEEALRALRLRFAAAAKAARKLGWTRAIGTSGTVKALHHLARAVIGAKTLDKRSLEHMRRALLGQDGLSAPLFADLKSDRRAVLAGGLLVMRAVFEEFGLESIEYCEAALRDGILIELSSELRGSDIRQKTVNDIARRYALDVERAERIALRALALYDQAARAVREERLERRMLLAWASQLAEVGRMIAHEDFHKHSAYVLRHADLPGFSRAEQQHLAHLVLGQTGGLRKLRGLFADELGWMSVLALRLALLLEDASADDAQPPPLPAFFFRHGEARIEIARTWLADHPIAHQALLDEARRWTDAQLVLRFELREL